MHRIQARSELCIDVRNMKLELLVKISRSLQFLCDCLEREIEFRGSEFHFFFVVSRTTTIHAPTRSHPSLSKARSCYGRRERRHERSQGFPSRFSMHPSFRTTSTSTWWIGRRRTCWPWDSAVAYICGVPVQVK
jgi:hypothetical protein